MSGQIKLKAPSLGGDITLTATDTASSVVLTLPAATATVLASSAASVSVINTVTNKIPVVIGGVTYYLLASTSAL
jgi:hypothetical protein